MNSTTPLLIEDTNLSYAWSRAFLHILDNPGKEISPLVITLTGFTNGVPKEDQVIRDALDNSLLLNSEQKIHTVANTIFPYSLWKHFINDRNKLFEMYLNALPRYKALEPHKNRRGIYFERLIAFGSGSNNVNQLEHIISHYKPGIRKSMFQASTFNPALDHINDKYLPFPCLQHVSFVPQNNEKTLTLNAFYATQKIFEKAYGNYLGLCRLGEFMAHEMGLTFEWMNCFIGVAKIDTITKSHSSITTLIDLARKALEISSGK